MIGAIIVSMTFAPEIAFAHKRVALVVGNSSYQAVPQLPNPSRDASAVAQQLTQHRPVTTARAPARIF